MTPSCCLSSTRNTTTQESLLHCPQIYLSIHPSSFLAHEISIFKKECLLKPQGQLPKSSYPILRLRTTRFTYPLATISSFAEAEDEKSQEIDIEQVKNRDAKSNDLPGMAQAFHISSSSASAISISIALAALTLPL
ncbi:hypothetical protein Nepgr_032956 [Nepenthes gracilis]|uniref:Uncharacterized protein n=1 Tax=Nepenthes gracilis TaxID=150966 RepID=A0AAD3TJN2_NEPGR|nr:hypothetical protein Nepgr_032956 [Nepenthes gracilis]